MKKIAIVNQPIDGVIPPGQTSIGIWTYKVAPYLAENFDVTVYARRNRMQRSWKREEHLQYHFVPSLPKRVIDRLEGAMALAKPKNLPVFATQLYYLDYISWVASRIRRQRADIVHIHNFTQFVPIVRAFNKQAKIVLHMNGEWLSQLDADVMAKRAAQCDMILGSSDHISNLIRARFPQLADRCHTVYNGVDINTFAPYDTTEQSKKGKRLLFVGRVSPEKGVHVLLKAFPIVAEKYPDVYLDIVGPVGAMPAEYLVGLSNEPEVHSLLSLYSEPYGTYLERLVPPKLIDRVRFLGPLPHDTLVKQYREADILINPSYSESFGMSLVEALASERPVVATRVGGMVEIVNEDKYGILVSRGDEQGLAEAILSLLDDEQRRTAIGKAGREMVIERFAWSQIGKRVSDLYATLVNTDG
ncbi:MAG: glycosyltransferase family 4 protein [Hyphomicrobiaceae bacterium]